MSPLTGFSSVIGLALAYGAIAVQPGANFMFVSGLGMAGRREHACLAALGVAAGAASVTALTFYGTQHMEAVVSRLWMLQLIYAALLAKVGIDTLRRARESSGQETTVPMSLGSCLRTGFVTAATNPVTVVFLVGLATIPTTLDKHEEPGFAALTIFVVALGWFSLVALFFSTPRVRAVYKRIRPWANLAMGTIFLMMSLNIIIQASKMT